MMTCELIAWDKVARVEVIVAQNHFHRLRQACDRTCKRWSCRSEADVRACLMEATAPRQCSMTWDAR